MMAHNPATDGIFVNDRGVVSLRAGHREIAVLLDPDELRSFAAALIEVADQQEARASGPAAAAIGKAMGHA